MRPVLSAVSIRAFWPSLLALLAVAWFAYAATASAGTPSSVYDGKMHWENWSWGTEVSTEKTWPLYEGEKTLSVTFKEAWAAMSFATSAFDTDGYTHLEFMVHGNGRGLPPLQAILHDKDGNELETVGVTMHATPAGQGWYAVSIPLKELGAKDTKVSRITLQDRNGSGMKQFNLAEVRFVKTDYEPAPEAEEPEGYAAYVFDDQAHWDNWSWDTKARIESSWPTYAGTASIDTTYKEPWAGLSFATDGFVSGYTHVQFAFHTDGGPIPALIARVADGDYVWGSVKVTEYITDIQNGWYVVSIPLADIGASGESITRVTIQEGAGKMHRTFYVDELRFYHN